jgi:hypothetical protein
MANVIPPPLPLPPPPHRLLNQVLPNKQTQVPNAQNPVVNAKVAQMVRQPSAQTPAQTQTLTPKKPYITITNLTTAVDASIGRHVDDLDERIALKELPVIGPSGTSKSTSKKR